MRIALALIIGIHGIIHLFGFIKAFNLSQVKGLTLPITKPTGAFWLAAFVLFMVSLILVLARQDYWWVVGTLAIVLSQVLIIAYWKDAKFGTILNIVILAACIVSYSTQRFLQKTETETTMMLANSVTPTRAVISEQEISGLPKVVKKWMLVSGVLEKEVPQSVYLEQEAELVMEPEHEDWKYAKATQYFTIEPPAFNWLVSLKMNPILPVAGRDKFENGKGEMAIKLFSIFPVVDEKDNEKINQATLQRYLAEIVWFPFAALSPSISWDSIDNHTAKATMIYNGTEGSGIFHFNDNGHFEKFVAMRYRDTHDEEPTEWTVTATKNEERNGIQIPVKCEVKWKLQTGDWTWLKLKISHIEYRP